MKVEADGFDQTVKIEWGWGIEPVQYVCLGSCLRPFSAKELSELIMKAYSIGKIDGQSLAKTHGVSVRLNGH